MFIILGASGHIGSEVVKNLGKAGQDVLAVVHDAEKAQAIQTDGVQAAVVDLNDSDALRAVFRRGKRAFLLNPPGDTSQDSDALELATAKSITEALVDSGLEKVVLASSYGAQPGDAIGDLSTLYAFETAAKSSGVALAINRGAYYFTNLDMLLGPAKGGSLPTPFPETLALPMVAPVDLAKVAVERLLSPVDDVGIVDVEGPERYSFADVAATFAKYLGNAVTVQTTPRDQWAQSLMKVGFSERSARSFARMTAATVDQPALPEQPRRGSVTLDDYVRGLTRR